MNREINVVGAGLAGCEAAWRAANDGLKVRLFEMKPIEFSPAHKSEKFAELVCSNSLRASALSNAAGLLKEEMRRLGGLVMEAADANLLPAGGATAVDREGFADYITQKIKGHENIEVITERVSEIPSGLTVIATGPLTDGKLADAIQKKAGGDYLHFHDASAPIVDFASINMDKAFFASRYDKGGADYINCPMNREEYEAFYFELIHAERTILHDFDKRGEVFEGCMPVEVMASRGIDTLLFGPLKPVGLVDPRTGKNSHAVVQLRKDNKDGTMYNIVGFQTNLTFGEQKRVFSMIPGLENAEFLRYGVMHRNSFISSPKLLDKYYRLRNDENLYFAGQFTGVEGYIESASSGLMVGINISRAARGLEPIDFPKTTAIGALAHYVSDETVVNFQPMNINFGIMAPLDVKVKGGKRVRNEHISERALSVISEMKNNLD